LSGPIHVTLALLFFAGILPPNRRKDSKENKDSNGQLLAYQTYCQMTSPFVLLPKWKGFIISETWEGQKRVGFGLGMHMVAIGKWC